eukprot:614512-Rhodomonas_salina.5
MWPLLKSRSLSLLPVLPSRHTTQAFVDAMLTLLARRYCAACTALRLAWRSHSKANSSHLRVSGMPKHLES